MTMQDGVVLVGAGCNLVVLLGIVLKAGRLLMVIETLTGTVGKLEQQVDKQAETIARVVAVVETIEKRVERLEHSQDDR